VKSAGGVTPHQRALFLDPSRGKIAGICFVTLAEAARRLSAVGSFVLTAPAQGVVMAASSALTPTSAITRFMLQASTLSAISVDMLRRLRIRKCVAPIQHTSIVRLRHDLRGGQMADDRIRRPMDSRQAAEAAFKKATTKPLEPVARQPSIPNAKELVSLRIDRDVLEYFQESGPGWQDRINEALKKVAGK
jgi:uncharacterized protein (DUF4415 family)